jgi:hypothetical protein
MSRVRIVIRGTAVGVLLLLAFSAAPSAAGAAEFGIVPGSVEVRTVDGEGNPDTRAGVHPNGLQVSFGLVSEGTGTSARDFVFEFDPGLGGNPNAGPTCPRPVFEDEGCPANTQVGAFRLQLGSGEPFDEPIYNIAPAPKQLAAFGFKPFWKTLLEMDLRPSDYGLRLRTAEIPQLPLASGRVELWGIPADHLAEPPPERIPFLTTPTRCGPLGVTFRTRSWEVGAPWLSETAETAPFTGCDNLPFAPQLGFDLGTRTADSPTGARIDLGMPKHDGADESVSSNIRDVRVDLPPGVTISPGGAEGLESCRDAQFGLGAETPIACPPLSRVGSVEISTPQFGETLNGSIYLGEERPGERFRLFVGASARGIELKAFGKLVTDPKTGQLAAVLNGLPQVSLNRISLNFDGGSHALLATPLSCGPATARGHFVPYSGTAPVDASAAVDIVSGQGGPSCPSSLRFSPGVVAGSTKTQAGRNTDFLLTLTRQDGEQLPKRFSVTLPTGVNAVLGAIDPCQKTAAATGSCADGSRIGSAVGEIGSGPSPALVRGNVYLTETYRGAPFGLSVVFKAAIGPFDLGALNIRGTLRLDGRTGQVTIATDPLPLVFEGIPLRFKAIGMELNRPGLLSNPTSCEPKKIASTVDAVDGRTASITTPFSVRGCNKLGFRPEFRSTLTDQAELHDGGHPGVRFAARMPQRGANLSRFRVKFPRLLTFHGAGVRAICARGDAIEGLCQKASRVGTSIVRTPLLKQPLRGHVYLVQPKGGGLPDLWSSVEAKGVKINVAGKTLRQDGRLVTEIVGLPDMPLSEFAMRLSGGKAGPFSLNGSLCAAGRPRPLVGPVEAEGQNGAYRLGHVRMTAKIRC